MNNIIEIKRKYLLSHDNYDYLIELTDKQKQELELYMFPINKIRQDKNTAKLYQKTTYYKVMDLINSQIWKDEMY